MKTLSIRELHATTGKIVRAAQKESYFVTDHGTVVAVLRAASPADLPGRPFPKGHWGRAAHIRSGDSTRSISDDRNR